MVTQKANETIHGAMHDLTSVVELGTGLDGKPAAKVIVPTNEWNSTALAFRDPLILRDLAGDLQTAAQYIEDKLYGDLYGEDEKRVPE